MESSTTAPIRFVVDEAGPAPNRSSFFTFRAESLWLIAAVFVGYYAGARLGFLLTFEPRPVAVLWPPNSILMALLLIAPRRTWWALLVAALPAHWLVQLQSEVPPRMIFCWYLSNCCEALIGAIGIRCFLSPPVRLDRLRNVAVFCAFGMFLAPLLSSFLDAGFVILNQWGSGTYWGIWRIRLTSNMLATLMITPLIVIWITQGRECLTSLSRRQLREGALLFIGLFVISFVLFNKVSSHEDSALVYAPLPFLLWAAVRFGTVGVSTAVAAVSFLAIWGVTHETGPFSEGSPEENALYVQVFLIFMGLPSLFLAALIEERNHVEVSLRERDERIGLAAETASLALWTIDFQRDESWISEKGREVFGFAPGQKLSREAFLSRVHPEDREKVDEAIERARSAVESFEIEFRIVRPNGETRWVISRGRYLCDERGQLSELIGVAIDETDRVVAHLELRSQREEMARLNRMASMGEITTSLAHELNQPLSAIMSNAHAGIRFLAVGKGDPETLSDILSDVVADGRRASDIIANTRNAIKKETATRSQIDFNNLVTAVTRMVHGDAALNSCELNLSLAKDLPAIEGDPVQIQQVLVNLITNAFDAMRETPVANRKVEIGTERKGAGILVVTVRDYGSGLRNGEHEQVFEQFFTTKSDGLGMGLAIARSLVESHGGRIAAENAVGGGARFRFELPANPTPTV